MSPFWGRYQRAENIERTRKSSKTEVALYILRSLREDARRAISQSGYCLLLKSIGPLSLEENMEFIRDQIVTFRDMLKDVEDVIEAKDNQVEAIIRRIRDLNASIRAQKKTLLTDGRVTSFAAVQEHLQVEASLIRLQEAAQAAVEVLGSFEELSNWAVIRESLQTLACLKTGRNEAGCSR